MQENSSDGSSTPASDWVDPIEAEALFRILGLWSNKVLENDLNKTNCWIVASSANISSNSDTSE